MKKLLLILILILFCSTKCDDEKDFGSYIFKNSYSQVKENKALHDIDSLVKVYKIQNITLDKWMTLKMDKENGYIEQKMISKYSDTTLTIIYSKYVLSDTNYYELRVRQIIKSK